MELLALHAVRLRGMPDAAAVAARFDLDPDALGEELLAAELDEESGRRERVGALYGGFLSLNGALRTAVTDWQIRPADGAPYAVPPRHPPSGST